MIVNGTNYLLLERRGCNFFDGDEAKKWSDVGNYRVFVRFADKNGVEICGDFTTSRTYQLCADLQYEAKSGNCLVYTPVVRRSDYWYTKQDILDYVNDIASEHYEAIKFVERFSFRQKSGENFTPARAIHKFARDNNLRVVNKYDSVVVRLSTGDYKYLAYEIKPLDNGEEEVEIILEQA